MAGEKLVQIMQDAALNAVDNKGMADFMYGEVADVMENPLFIKVKVDNRFELDTPFLILPKHLTDYKVMAEISGENKEITIKNALKQGDKIVLLRAIGGQRYYILDRVVK